MRKPVIEVHCLKKFYCIHKKEPGLLGSLRSIVRRRYLEVKAVDDISFNIEEGELVGFIGPNGAGKTTTLKCLSGLLYPTAGRISVLGFNPWQRQPEFLKQIAFVMGQRHQLWWDLPPMETFLLNKEIYEIEEEKYKKTLDELTDLLEIKEILKIPVRQLSLGQRMKCELVASLLHQPQVLFLDEPTIGLDVVMQKKMRDFIKVYNYRHKATIILTSHYMGDVQELCQRVIIIDQGKIVFDGPLAKVIEKYADYKILEVVFEGEIDSKKLAEIGEIKEYSFPRAIISVSREVSSMAAAKLLQKFPVADLNILEVPIEEIIRKLFTGKDYG